MTSMKGSALAVAFVALNASIPFAFVANAEVNVDAKTGKIVAVKKETPAKEKHEAKAEPAEKQ